MQHDGLRSFFERAADRGRADRVDDFHLNEFVGQEFHGPSGLAFGWFGTGDGNVFCFLLAIEFAVLPTGW